MEKKRLIRPRQMTVIILVFAMLLQLTACGSADTNSSLMDEPGHGKWIDSDLKGSVKADDTIRLQDDFAAAANQKAITSVQVRDQLSWAPDGDDTDLLQT